MPLKDMKITSKEAKKETAIEEPDDQPRFPFGLSIHVDEVSLKKLDMDLPEVGSEFTLLAKVEVTDTHSSEHNGGEPNQSMTLQITEMALEAPEKAKSVAEKIYGDD